MYRRETRTCFVSKGADGDKGGSGEAKSRFPGSMKARPPDLPGYLGGFRSVLVATVLAGLVVERAPYLGETRARIRDATWKTLDRTAVEVLVGGKV
jgi:hypothetical protein